MKNPEGPRSERRGAGFKASATISPQELPAEAETKRQQFLGRKGDAVAITEEPQR